MELSKDTVKSYKQMFILLMVLAFIVRFNFANTDRDFWHDESFQYLYSERPASYILDSTDVHPPLFNLITKALVATGIHDVFWLRYFILSISLVFVWQFCVTASELFNPRAGLIATLFVALSPTFVYYSTEFRNYSFVLLLTVIQIRYFNRMLNDKRWAVYGLLSLAMVYSHYMAGLIIFVQMVYVAFNEKKYLRYYAMVYSKIAILCIPLAIYVLRTLPKIQSFWFHDIGLISLISAFTYTFAPPLKMVVGYSLFFYGLMAYFILFKEVSLDKKHIQLLLYIFLPVITMWTISQVYPFYHPRYFIFGGMCVFMFVGDGLVKLRKHIKEIDLFLIGFFVIISINGLQMTADTFNTEILDSARFIYNETGNNSVMYATVHTSPFSQTPYKFYIPNRPTYLLTNLTKEQRFTSGGAVINDWEIIHNMSELDFLNYSIYGVSDRPLSKDIIFEEGGLYVAKIR